MQVQSLSNAVTGLFPLIYNKNVANMNIIFDLSGVFFEAQTSKPCSIQNRFACALKPINVSASMRILHDCLNNGHRLFVVSNLNLESFDFLSADPQAARLFNYFEDIILSDQVGIQKSDPRIFNYLIEKHGLNPRHSVFVDDQIVNLKAAEQAGITKGIHCTDFNFGSLRQQLEIHGAL
ncbi:MAG: hypothetical protein ACJAZS_000860 [Alteromonas naphthalenivorans]|jgi:hypothetical protein